jgi:High-affinity nickel-transport protein
LLGLGKKHPLRGEGIASFPAELSNGFGRSKKTQNCTPNLNLKQTSPNNDLGSLILAYHGNNFMIASLPILFNDARENLRRVVISIYALLFAANIAAWAWALVALHDFPVLLGTAMLAYSFGLRHAFDADHIATIDNVTRKLMQEGKRPVAVGLFFSLGHSTIVVGLSVAIAITATALQSQFDTFKTVGGVVGTLVSALFLFAIAFANILVLISVYRTFRTVKKGGRFVEEDLDLVLANRALLGRLFRRSFPSDRTQLVNVPVGCPIRPRLRHGDGSRSSGDFRHPGIARSVNLVDFGIAGAVHGRYDADRYDGQHPDVSAMNKIDRTVIRGRGRHHSGVFPSVFICSGDPRASTLEFGSKMAAHMVPCLDHEAVDRAHRHAKPSSDLGMGQPLDPIEQKGITAERRQF